MQPEIGLLFRFKWKHFCPSVAFFVCIRLFASRSDAEQRTAIPFDPLHRFASFMARKAHFFRSKSLAVLRNTNRRNAGQVEDSDFGRLGGFGLHPRALPNILIYEPFLSAPVQISILIHLPSCVAHAGIFEFAIDRFLVYPLGFGSRINRILTEWPPRSSL